MITKETVIKEIRRAKRCDRMKAKFLYSREMEWLIGLAEGWHPIKLGEIESSCESLGISKKYVNFFLQALGEPVPFHQ